MGTVLRYNEFERILMGAVLIELFQDLIQLFEFCIEFG